jgi:hypothetical protein
VEGVFETEHHQGHYIVNNEYKQQKLLRRLSTAIASSTETIAVDAIAIGRAIVGRAIGASTRLTIVSNASGVRPTADVPIDPHVWVMLGTAAW